MFQNAEIFSADNSRGSCTWLVLRQIRNSHQLHFGYDQMTCLGWTPGTGSPPTFAFNALRRFQQVVSVYKSLVGEFYNSELPDAWVATFDSSAWHASHSDCRHGNRTRTQLTDNFSKFVRHQHLEQCDAEFELLRNAALDIFTHKLLDSSAKAIRQGYGVGASMDRDCWVLALMALETRTNVDKVRRVLCRYFAFQPNSASNERDINKVKSMIGTGACKQLITDIASLRR